MKYAFKSERIGFRRWTEEDKEPFSAMNGDKEVMAFFPKTLSKSESDAFVQKINRMFENHGYGLYAVDALATNTFMGFIGFWHPSFKLIDKPIVEIGWRIRKKYWNKGLATEGAIACLKWGFEELKFNETHSLTAKINKKSERIMQKTGMEKVLEFEHPHIPIGSELNPHVLYKIVNAKFAAKESTLTV